MPTLAVVNAVSQVRQLDSMLRTEAAPNPRQYALIIRGSSGCALRRQAQRLTLTPAAQSSARAAQQLDVGSVKQQLRTLLSQVTPVEAVFPRQTEARQRVNALVQCLEDVAGAGQHQLQPGQLTGSWRLVYASKGTVVTRSAIAQLLVSLSALPGTGLKDISQQLQTASTPGALLEAANSAIFGLGPLGSYEVGIQGRWLPDASQAGSKVEVAFDAFSVRLVGYLGLPLPAGLPKITIPMNRETSAEWWTPYADEEFRLGKGKSGNLFLFWRS